MTDNAEIRTITMEQRIKASPARVWEALTSDIGAWWPEEFYGGGESGQRDFSLDATPGGLMVEHWEGGGGLVWANVICSDPAKMLQVIGQQFPNWGGPSQWYGTWTLKADGDDCVLGFTEAALGRISASGMEEKDKGWRFSGRL